MVNHPADEYRAELDFEVTFTNGGSLRGREFRIDIDHPGMTEDELAEALIRDLGLLMVGRVDIHSRQVMRGQHRRGQARPPVPEPLPDAPGRRRQRRHTADLSHVIEDGMITYPGLPAPQVRPESVSSLGRASYAPGVEFRIGEVTICGNTGTYLDSPAHRYADADDLAELPLGKLAELDGVRVDVTGSGSGPSAAASCWRMTAAARPCSSIPAGTSTGGPASTSATTLSSPRTRATYLAGTGAVLVGIDSLNIDDTGDPERPVHSLLLAAGIPVCEHLTNLAALPGRRVPVQRGAAEAAAVRHVPGARVRDLVADQASVRPLTRCSRSSRKRLRPRPPPYPVRLPSAPMTRWHGTMTETGFLPLARPTARDADSWPMLRASSP